MGDNYILTPARVFIGDILYILNTARVFIWEIIIYLYRTSLHMGSDMTSPAAIPFFNSYTTQDNWIN